MGLFDDAIAVAAGELAVHAAADSLEAAEASRPIPLAAYRADDRCVVFFVIKHSSGADWTTEIVTVHRGEVGPSGGGTGGILRKSDVQRGEPAACGEFRFGVDLDTELVSVEGVSADEAVRMVSPRPGCRRGESSRARTFRPGRCSSGGCRGWYRGGVSASG